MGKVVKNYDDILKEWLSKSRDDEIIDDEGNKISVKLSQSMITNLIIDFDIQIPFPENIKNEVEPKYKHLFTTTSYLDCEFLKEVEITDSNQSKHFERCIFPRLELKQKLQKSNFTFKNCTIKNLDFENVSFGKALNVDNSAKVRFHNCNLYYVDFTNTTFGNLADFYGTTFHNRALFLRTDFLGTAVFSSATFLENALFTYVLFQKYAIFNQTIFKNGIDLSQCIIEGNLTFFETVLDNFKSEPISGSYYNAINKDGIIPHQNKRETFRIIKHQLIQQNNLIEAEKYAKLEKQTYVEEIIKGYKFNKISSLFSLFLSKISNNFKTSWLLALIFIFVIAFIFDIWLGNISTVYLYTDNTLIKLINPTDFSFYDKFENNGYAYKVYLAGKIVIGFGIYQLIQAFRKFK